MTPFAYSHVLLGAMPELILSLAALAILFVDLMAMRGEPERYRKLAAAGILALASFVAIFWMHQVKETYSSPGMFADDGLTRLVRQALIVLMFFSALTSVDARFTEHTGEFFALLIFATVGMMFLASSENLLLMFVSLEMTSLSLYALTAFHKRSAESAEAAMKYFLFGGIAAAFTLFGLSLIYGASATLEFSGIAQALRGRALDPLLACALVMVILGFGFKVAAAPFHLWAPDAYQGAPAPAAALIASGSKLASFLILAKVLLLALPEMGGAAFWGRLAPGWKPLLAALAALSVIFGNLAAISQSNLKRLLAYSAIAHAGYALIGLLAAEAHVIPAVFYYMTTYALTVIGAFGVAALMEGQGSRGAIADLAGMSRQNPLIAACMMIFMLSLSGIPPLPGFIGKFYLFSAAASSDMASFGLIWLVALALVMSAVSLYYYLKALKAIYVTPPASGAVFRFPLAGTLAVATLALLVILAGLFPNQILGPVFAAMSGVAH